MSQTEFEKNNIQDETDTSSSSYDFDNLERRPSRIRDEFNKGFTYFLVILAGLLIFFALWRLDDIFSIIKKFLSILSPLFYGLVFAFLLNPLMEMMEKLFQKLFTEVIKVKDKERRFFLSRLFAILFAVLIVLVVIALVLNMILPQLYDSIARLISTLPEELNELIRRVESLDAETTVGSIATQLIEKGNETLQKWLNEDLAGKIALYMEYLTNGLVNFVSVLANCVIGLIIAVYILQSKEKFAGQCKKTIYAMLRVDRANFVLSICRKSNEIFGGFLIGKLIDSVIIGIICFIGMSIFRISPNYVLLVSVIVGVTNIIPVFGPYIGAVPSALLILLENPRHGLYFIIFIIVLQQLDGNVIGPKILGNSTGLSAFWVIIAIILGGGLFGFIGMIIGVPAFAVLYYIIRMVLDARLKNKNLPVASGDYIDIERFNVRTYAIDILTEEEKARSKAKRKLFAESREKAKQKRTERENNADSSTK